jgi:hypothetical protein
MEVTGETAAGVQSGSRAPKRSSVGSGRGAQLANYDRESALHDGRQHFADMSVDDILAAVQQEPSFTARVAVALDALMHTSNLAGISLRRWHHLIGLKKTSI